MLLSTSVALHRTHCLHLTETNSRKKNPRTTLLCEGKWSCASGLFCRVSFSYKGNIAHSFCSRTEFLFDSFLASRQVMACLYMKILQNVAIQLSTEQNHAVDPSFSLQLFMMLIMFCLLSCAPWDIIRPVTMSSLASVQKIRVIVYKCWCSVASLTFSRIGKPYVLSLLSAFYRVAKE